MKKILILLPMIFLILIGCGEENKIYETKLYEDKIEFPFTEINNGRFINIFRNSSSESVSASVVMVTNNNNVIPDSQNLDFCEGIDALRNGKSVLEWTVINHNYSFIPESKVENQNDHPGIISYSLPKGTYIIMLTDSSQCNTDNYAVFDVKTNDGLQQ